jgi:hypothetical protein
MFPERRFHHDLGVTPWSCLMSFMVVAECVKDMQ